MLPWSLMSRIVPVVVFEKTYGIIIGAGVSRRIVGRSAVLNLQEFRGNISFALICYTFSKLSMFLFDVFGTWQRSVGLCFDESFLHSEPRDGGEGEQKGMR